MTTPDQRLFAVQVRTILIEAYRFRGNEFALGLARRCVWEIGDVVAELHGREMAGAMLDEVSNAVLGDAMPGPMPPPDLQVPDGMMAMTVPRTAAEADALIAWVGRIRDTVALPAPAVVRRPWWKRLGWPG
jgi:hypothetical protein